MKIYTKTGDDGTTGLFGGGRVRKDHSRVEAYGTVDELNCHVGQIRSLNPDRDVDETLGRIQSDLFALGADLATPSGSKAAASIRRLSAADAEWMEDAIDRFDKEIVQLQTFILPGGSPAAAAAHVARAVCRRAERSVVSLDEKEPVGESAVVVLNRLSDLLFTLGRVLNHRSGRREEPWKGP